VILDGVAIPYKGEVERLSAVPMSICPQKSFLLKSTIKKSIFGALGSYFMKCFMEYHLLVVTLLQIYDFSRVIKL